MDRPPKIYIEKIFFGKNRKKNIFLAIYQLKNTSDCIKIDPPGPGRSLEKSQKKSKKWSKILDDFFGFFWVWVFLPNRFFISKKQVFSAGASPGAPLRGALGRAPPPFGRVEILKKFTGKSVPENYTLFFGKNYVFGHFTYQNALICI